jgi:hypothetical protein
MRNVHDAFETPKNKYKRKQKLQIHLILAGFKILAILKVEKDSFMIMPFNPTRLKHRDFTTSISAP